MAKTASHLEKVIFAIVKYLVAFDAVLVGAVLTYAFLAGMAAGIQVALDMLDLQVVPKKPAD